MDFLGNVVLALITLFLFSYWRFKKAREFFDKNGVAYLKPTFLVGNIAPVLLMNKPMAVYHKEMYEKLHPHKHAGYFLFNRSFLMIRDPDLIRHIMVKDFKYFHDRSIPINPKIDRIGHNLLTMKGDEWKTLRVKLTSTFTSGKMKLMFPLVQECGNKLTQVLGTMTSEAFNIKDLSARYTCDVIGTCAFGIETHSLDDPNNEFQEMGKRVFRFRYRNLIAGAFTKLPESVARFFNIRFVDESVQDFFISIIGNTVKFREENKVTRNDFIDLLMSLRDQTMSKYNDHQEQEDLERFLSQVGEKHAKGQIDMTIDVMAAQCFIFFGAGFETSSTALSFLLLELALHQDIQDKVREEINTLINSNPEGLTYDILKDMTYVDMVIAEGLRKYPALGFIIRECTEDYIIPDTKIVVPKNTPVTVPVYGLHNDPQYFEKPDEFYPEHFTKEAIAKRPHYTYLPFGDGPRGCIGERFGKMQVKVGLISMIRNFKFQLSPKTSLPIKFQQHFIILKPKSGIWLKCEKI
uniref:Cytochrome P450 6PZ32 n=1 Tax=Maconellicoccus hirsutus TaxID=177089 RepID=A0AAT9UTL7_MACHI